LLNMEAELAELLTSLGLEELRPVLEEEAITELVLLSSMGDEMLRENLLEIGISEGQIAMLSRALFPQANVCTSGVTLEEPYKPSPSGGLPAESKASSSKEVVVFPEMTEAEADAINHAEWILKPFLINDLPELKRQLIKLSNEADAYFRRGQFANAVATYSRALQLEAPNKKANAALHYNRAACHKRLGNVHLAMRDATLAAEINPEISARAWWRVAGSAFELGDAEAAEAALRAGLKVQPGCVALKALAMQLEASARGV